MTSYGEVAAVVGAWKADGTDVDWVASNFVTVPESQSTRGLEEATLVDLDTAGKCMMVAKGRTPTACRSPSSIATIGMPSRTTTAGTSGRP